MDNKDNLIHYANGFSMTSNADAGEMIISFTQNQPIFDAVKGEFVESAPREVATIIIPFALGAKLGEILEQSAKDAE